ncbi:uncharacterized protein LOC111407817 isoform X2 [Olea europaea var. sylvestris]|uniref:uncharacterized protein LOC111407817 isoform X2 n=1 Tax=Olea europaea var. sylvestris TaxID=158386 RepID=UPI000C1D4320|nr:uncharacterized protein LOC111407817 isoform X2 [Olea europaea var. sylvestris]
MATLFSLFVYSSTFLFLKSPILKAFCSPSDFSIIDYDDESKPFRGDYSLPSPPSPSPPMRSPSLSCEDLKGIGSLNTTCELSYSLNITQDVYIEGNGNLFILQGISLICPELGCSIEINITGEFRLNPFAKIVAGSVYIVAGNASLFGDSLINVTALAGEPPEDSTGTPREVQGGGGGHGGRGASCVMDSKMLPEDVWGGDTYSWESLGAPRSYGSKGGTTNREENYGGKGGGRIWLEVKDIANVCGLLLANGGSGGIKGGGGSGGSIYIKSPKMTGSGRISAIGGNGFAGGGGGRVSVNAFSRHDDPVFLVHGGRSFGCPANSGAAGTFFDAVPRRLIIDNYNMSTDTDTLLLQFPNQPLWTNVYIRNGARANFPLLWSRVQVRGQLSLSWGAFLSFGLIHYALSEFELMAEELLMSDSVIKVYGALRMSVKIHLMLNSKMLICGDSDEIVATSLIEASNLVVLKGSSMIHSTANLGLHGQGSLNLSGPGDLIEAQRLVLSLFYAIRVGPESVLRGPLENSSDNYMSSKLYCEQKDCPIELLHPPEDCNVNASLSFTLQICRVEDIIVEGFLEGSIIHFHWVRTVVVKSSGAISASGLGCTGGLGRGEYLPHGVGSGAGHGGKGGDAYNDGSYIKGGVTYGNAELPCELGSGSGNESLPSAAAGGGIIVMGSLDHSLSKLILYGTLRADGENPGKYVQGQDDGVASEIGSGGGSGGTVLLFVHNLVLGDTGTISTSGGHGSHNSGGGGGGRVHFHWSDIFIGEEYLPVALVKGTINLRGGVGRGLGQDGENGTVSGKACPKGLYGIFCRECPLGTYKNLTGSDRALCRDCPSHQLPHRAIYIAVRGGVTDSPCPYNCVSERYHMPHCYTAIEELMYTFGGPWLFGLTLASLLIILALVLSVARMKFVGSDELPGLVRARCCSPIDRSFPFLESLNEVLETSRVEESQTHVHRMYFMGANTFSEPWHLPHSPPKEIKEIVYEDAFNRFVDEINALASYQWWEGSVYSILCVITYPLAWSWRQWCRKKKMQHLREYVRSEYDHACLRSCRSRALYEGLKVTSTSDLMLAYVDFFLGGDEKRDDLPPPLPQRFPMYIVFGGDGSYMTPFSLHSDNILTNLMSQSVPPTIWYRFVAGLNAQLRLVRRGHLKATFHPVICWLETHANRTLSTHGVHVELICFQPSASGYRQFGLLVCAIEDESTHSSIQGLDKSLLLEQHSQLPGNRWKKALNLVRVSEQITMQKKISGEILHAKNLQKLEEKIHIDYPFYYIICNTRPVCHQDLVGLVISILLLADFSLVLLTLLQLYSISLLDVFLVLSVLPLGILLPFPAGINALFSHGPRRSAGLARIYALWNINSVINVVVAFVCGIVHFKTQSSSNKKHPNFQSWNFIMDESGWWMLPFGLVFCKSFQAQLINCHVANLEIQDPTLYSNDPNVFWQS